MDNGNEMITRLPEALMILIISFLPLVDAMRLCSLSRQWLHLWIYSRRLEFDENRFIDTRYFAQLMHVGRAAKAWRTKNSGRRRFVEYVHTTLPRFVQPDIFKLSICYEVGYDQYIEDWVRLAIAKDVQEINLDFSDGEPLQFFRTTYQTLFEVPDFLHEGKSLQVLSLNFCRLRSLRLKTFTALTSLSLSCAFFTTDLAQNLETNFPLLKNLSLVECTIFKKLEISSPNLRLERLIVRGCMPLVLGIEIFAPRLQYFEYLGHMLNFEIGKLDELVEVVLDFEYQTRYSRCSAEICYLLQGLKNAKVLTLCTYILKVYFFINSCLFSFATAPLLARSSRIYVRLEGLWEPPDFPFSHLKTIKVDGYTGSQYEMDLLKFMLRNARVLETVIVIPRHLLSIRSSDEVSPLTSWTVEDLEHLECASRQVQIIYQPMEWINLWTHSNIIALDESSFVNTLTRRTLLNSGQQGEALYLERVGRRRFVESINRILPLLVVPMFSKFSVRFCYESNYHEKIEEWIKTAVIRNVEELNLDFSEGDSLKPLPEFYKPEYHIGKYLYDNGGFIKFRLQKLVVRDCELLPLGIKLCSPTLRYFEYAGLVRFNMQQLENLEEVVLEFGFYTYPFYQAVEVKDLLCGFNHARVFTICSFVLKVSFSEYYLFEQPLLQMVNLEHLTLKTCLEGYELPGILYLLGSAPNLRTLTIMSGLIRPINEFKKSSFPPMPNGNWEPPILPLGHLKMVKVDGFTANTYEMNLLKYLLKRARILQTVTIIPRQNFPVGSTGGDSSLISQAILDLRSIEKSSELLEIVYGSMS
ncbi:hypothetical protein HHK36_005606 [Tetracentron sinense]|uniref:F-box domain-containing protein n=1 Tax=Tetracentron sinense TaxID=13715 RepID=A0A834ZKX3_TETSI|nr:hypothetical protein HHK36_005606 [Tetracentron sinense]